MVDGVAVDPVDADGLIDRVAELVAARRRATVTYVNVHVLDVATRDPALRAFLAAADLVYADGAGVVLGARLLGRRLPGRATGADWIWLLAARAEREGWKIAWVGGAPGVTGLAADALRARHPGLRIVATESGYTPREGPEHEALLARIQGADLVLVGMGTPEQERWVAANRERIDAPVVWCLGATADFVSGRTRRGPRLLYTRHEWLARLIVDPRRLWRRYLLGNPRFVVRVLRERRRSRMER